MNDQVVGEIRQLQTMVQNLMGVTKSVDQSLERLRSIEQLMERVAVAAETIVKSNEQLQEMMTKAWQAYDNLNSGLKG